MIHHSWQKTLAELPAERVVACNLCGSRDAAADERWGTLLQLPPPYAVKRCNRCGLRWLDPRPDAEGYARLYSDELYFGGKGASPDNYADLVKTRLRYFGRRLRMVESMQREKSLKILDFGAATGEFVSIARSHGHDCDGIELSIDARMAAKRTYGIELLAADDIAGIPPNSVDVLHMNHVLEHMPDPVQHLRWCNQRLRTAGLLVIEVPQQLDNLLDGLRRILRIGGRRLEFDAYSLHHTYFFSPKTLSGLCRSAGLTVIKCRTFNPAAAPLWPLSLRNWALHGLLRTADLAASAGNIIEIVATSSEEATEAQC